MSPSTWRIGPAHRLWLGAIRRASAIRPLTVFQYAGRGTWASWSEAEARRMAARLGLEPRQNESESFVLPLHHRAVGAKLRQHREMEPAMGFEPATACLQNRCSTIELRRRNSLRY